LRRATPAFAAALREGRRELLDLVTGLLLQEAGQATLELYGLLGCDEPPTRCRAALGILDRALRSVELADVADEVAELRQKVEGLNGGNGKASPRPFKTA
jgi:hypothetical protein